MKLGDYVRAKEFPINIYVVVNLSPFWLESLDGKWLFKQPTKDLYRTATQSELLRYKLTGLGWRRQ